MWIYIHMVNFMFLVELYVIKFRLTFGQRQYADMVLMAKLLMLNLHSG